MGFLEALRRAREVEVRRLPGGAVELRHVWMPYNRPLVFVALNALYALPLAYLFGLPRTREGAALCGGILAFIAYALAAQCFNSTRLSADAEGLSWRHGPLPWRLGGRIAAREIAAISFGEKPNSVSREESEMMMRHNLTDYRKPSFYAVSVRLRDARERRVLDKVGNAQEAEGAAQAIAGALGGLKVEQATQPDRGRRSGEWLSWLAIIGTLLLMVLIVVLAGSE
jgi:hypothetical protein